MTIQETLQAFLEAWTRKDYLKMYQYSQLTWKDDHSKEDLKNVIPEKINDFEILGFKPVLPTLQDATVKVKIKNTEREVVVRLLRESAPYKASESGTWGVNPISAIRGVYN